MSSFPLPTYVGVAPAVMESIMNVHMICSNENCILVVFIIPGVFLVLIPLFHIPTLHPTNCRFKQDCNNGWFDNDNNNAVVVCDGDTDDDDERTVELWYVMNTEAIGTGCWSDNGMRYTLFL